MTSKGNKPIARDPKKTNKLPDDTEDAVDSFLTEIESDIRDDQLRKLWFKYKNLFYGSMVALVLFVGSYQVWEKTEIDRLATQASLYDDAKVATLNKDFESALDLLSRVSVSGGNYGALADLQRAAIFLERKQTKEALAIYKSLAKKSNVSEKFRNLSLLLEIIHGLESEDPAYLSDLIEKLSDPSNSFAYNALEMKALIEFKEGNTSNARTILNNLLEDNGTPNDVIQRANEIITVLDSGYSSIK